MNTKQYNRYRGRREGQEGVYVRSISLKSGQEAGAFGLGHPLDHDGAILGDVGVVAGEDLVRVVRLHDDQVEVHALLELLLLHDKPLQVQQPDLMAREVDLKHRLALALHPEIDHRRHLACATRHNRGETYGHGAARLLDYLRDPVRDPYSERRIRKSGKELLPAFCVEIFPVVGSVKRTIWRNGDSKSAMGSVVCSVGRGRASAGAPR